MSIITKLFKILNEEKKKNKTRESLLEAIRKMSVYMGIPKGYELYLLELYMLNYREDGDYSDLTKENFIDPRKQKGKTISNTKANLYTIAQLPFKASNLQGYWDTDYEGNPYYKVVSYGWYPIFIFKNNKWYEVTERYSSSTSKQMSNANPVEWNNELKNNVYLLTRPEMKMLEQGVNHEEVMKHKLNKLKEIEPELTKRKKTVKTQSWQQYGERIPLPNANIKYKIKSVDVEGDKAIVTIDIYDVLNRVNNKEVPTTQNYLKDEMTGMSQKRAEDRVKMEVRRLLRDYMGTRVNNTEEGPKNTNVEFKFNHLKQ
jgi:hypothetical protein